MTSTQSSITDLKAISTYSLNRTKKYWPEGLIITMIVFGIILLWLALATLFHGVMLHFGFIPQSLTEAIATNPIYTAVQILLLIMLYFVMAPITFGVCWWYIHCLLDDSRELSCLFACFGSPSAYFKAICLKVIVDMPRIMLVILSVALVLFAHNGGISLINHFGGGVGLLVGFHILLICLICAIIYGNIVYSYKYTFIYFMYALNPDDSYSTLLKKCQQISEDNSSIINRLRIEKLKKIWMILPIISILLLIHYWLMLNAATLLAIIQKNNSEEKKEVS